MPNNNPPEGESRPYHPVFGSKPVPLDRSKNVSHLGEFRLENLCSHTLRRRRSHPNISPSERAQIDKILTQRASNLGIDPFTFIHG